MLSDLAGYYNSKYQGLISNPVMNEGAVSGWIQDAVAARFAQAPAGIEALKGDASSRRFWRVTLKGGGPDTPASAIAIDLGPEDLPLYARALRLLPEPLDEPPWLNVHRFLSAIGAPVPELYHAGVAARIFLVEDVGSLPLFDAAQSGDAADLYRLAVDALVLLHREGTKRITPACIAARVAYDERLFRWELEQFLEVGGALGRGAERGTLAGELDQLAACLGRLPRVLSHRDYHGNNLFMQYAADATPRLRMIDFQDALMAPAAQDLAVLLTTRDTSTIISERVEQRILDYYYAGGLRAGAELLDFNDFIESYRLCVLQHALKVIGRFLYLERTGKSGYARYVPYALAQARRMLAQLESFPALRAALTE